LAGNFDVKIVCGSDWDSLGELLPDWGYEVYADSLEGGFRHFLLRQFPLQDLCKKIPALFILRNA